MSCPVSTARLVEAFLEGGIAAGLWRDLRGWSCSTGEVLPAQYVLLIRDRPSVRAALRRATAGLLELLDIADAAHARGADDGCDRFRALASAPRWLLHPSEPDDSDPDVALVWERQVNHEGEWSGLLEALHQSDSVACQWAIRRCRTLMRFERDTGIDLASLLSAPEPRPKLVHTGQRRGDP